MEASGRLPLVGVDDSAENELSNIRGCASVS